MAEGNSERDHKVIRSHEICLVGKTLQLMFLYYVCVFCIYSAGGFFVNKLA